MPSGSAPAARESELTEARPSRVTEKPLSPGCFAEASTSERVSDVATRAGGNDASAKAVAALRMAHANATSDASVSESTPSAGVAREGSTDMASRRCAAGAAEDGTPDEGAAAETAAESAADEGAATETAAETAADEGATAESAAGEGAAAEAAAGEGAAGEGAAGETAVDGGASDENASDESLDRKVARGASTLGRTQSSKRTSGQVRTCSRALAVLTWPSTWM